MQLPQNPHNANPPEYNTDKYGPARQQLVDNFAITHEAAAGKLTDIWRAQNLIDRQEWDAHQADLAEQTRQEQERLRLQQEDAQRAKLQEEEEARKEERKRYRSKFLSFADVPPPSLGAIPINPSPLAIRKLQKGEYIPLYPFTNKGLAEAESLSYSAEEDALTLVPDDQGGHTFVPAAAAKAKHAIVEDKDLTWPQIDEATHRILQAMKEANWPQERMDAMLGFWMNLGAHEWRHEDETARQALLIYQAIYRRKWHNNLGTPSSFNLKHIDQEALIKIRAKITNQKHQDAERRATEASKRSQKYFSKYLPPHYSCFNTSFLHLRNTPSLTASRTASRPPPLFALGTGPTIRHNFARGTAIHNTAPHQWLHTIT